MDDTRCMSCTTELKEGNRRGVPAAVDCCRHCWNRIPVTDRLKIGIAIRDRSPGGVLNELADVLVRTIAMQQDGSI